MNVIWTGTGGVTDTHSYEWIILNAIFERLSRTSMFSNWACRRISSALPVEAWSQVPFLGVFLGSDDAEVDGEVQTGDFRFVHGVNIGFQIIVKNNDPIAMLSKLDEAYWFILNQLLRDTTLTNRFNTTLPDKTSFEGIPKIRRRPDIWGMEGSKNETPIGERLFQLQFRIRTHFSPTDFPELERITVTTEFPIGGDASSVKQVKVVYEFTPDAVIPPLSFDNTVNPTSIALSVSPASPQVVWTDVTFTATIVPTAVTGTVTFFDGVIVIGSAPVVVGSASLSITTLTVGAHSITARYNGDSTHSQSTSPVVPYTIQ